MHGWLHFILNCEYWWHIEIFAWLICDQRRIDERIFVLDNGVSQIWFSRSHRRTPNDCQPKCVLYRTSSVSLPLLFMLIFSFIQELLGPFSIPTKLLNENASCSHIICVCPYCSLWAMCLCAHFISPASNIFSAHTRAIRGSCHFRLCEFCHFQGLDNEKH